MSLGERRPHRETIVESLVFDKVAGIVTYWTQVEGLVLDEAGKAFLNERVSLATEKILKERGVLDEDGRVIPGQERHAEFSFFSPKVD